MLSIRDVVTMIRQMLFQNRPRQQHNHYIMA